MIFYVPCILTDSVNRKEKQSELEDNNLENI